MRGAAALLLVLLLVGGAGMAAKRKPRAGAGKFDYFALALSWAPEFCATSGGTKDVRECGTGRKVGFVVHGLWPEANTGRGPESCGTASPVGQSIVQAMLDYIPSASLIQHEWKTHGTCSGMSQADFFAAVRKTRDAIVIPEAFRAPSDPATLAPAEVEEKFAAANPNFPRDAFRATCSGKVMSGIRACFSKDLSPQACTSAAGQCSASSVTVLPVR